MGLAHSGGAAKPDILLFFHKPAGGQIKDLFLVDGGIEGEVKVLQALVGVKSGPSEHLFQFPGFPPFNLVFHQKGKEIKVGNFTADCLLVAHL